MTRFDATRRINFRKFFFFYAGLRPLTSRERVSGARAGDTGNGTDHRHRHAMLPSSWSSSSRECTIRALNAAAKDRRNEERIALNRGTSVPRKKRIPVHLCRLPPVRVRYTYRVRCILAREPADASLRANDACVTCERHRDAHTRKNLRRAPRAAGAQLGLRTSRRGACTIQMQGGRHPQSSPFRDIPESSEIEEPDASIR